MKIALIQRLQQGQNSGCLLQQCLLPKICQVSGWSLERFCHQRPRGRSRVKESVNWRKKMATKKSIVGREEPLETRSYQTSSKQ